MEKSEQIADLMTAFAKSKEEFKVLPKNGHAKFKTQAGDVVEYDYVELPDILDMVTPILAKNGMTLVQEQVTNNGTIEITMWFFHSTGQWMKWEAFALPITAMGRMSTTQSVGTAITFGRRYDILCKLGLAGEKDIPASELIDGKDLVDIKDVKRPQKKAKKGADIIIGKPAEESTTQTVIAETIPIPEKPKVDETVQTARNAVIAEIGEVLTNPVFTDTDKENVKNTIKECKTIEDLNKLKADCVEVEKIREAKQEKGE